MSDKTFSEIIVGTLSDLSDLFITFIAGLSLLVFIYGVTKYIWKGDTEDARKKGKQLNSLRE